MTVDLAPLNLIDRLEEYRSDENLYYTLLGVFAGGILGILANWATTALPTLPPFSVILIILLLILAAADGVILWRLGRRKAKVSKRIRG
jgi:hypothetical protein